MRPPDTFHWEQWASEKRGHNAMCPLHHYVTILNLAQHNLIMNYVSTHVKNLFEIEFNPYSVWELIVPELFSYSYFFMIFFTYSYSFRKSKDNLGFHSSNIQKHALLGLNKLKIEWLSQIVKIDQQTEFQLDNRYFTSFLV